MIAFWIAAALLSAATAGLIVYRGARAARTVALAGDSPTAAVYRRQLAELDDLAARGLLAEGEQRSARAEAARRLLGAVDEPTPALSATSGRMLIAALAGAAPLLALGLYFVVGSPERPDQPFARRVDVWQAADPGSLDPERMSAVLQRVVARRPGDAQALYYLARAQQAAGDVFSAEQSLKKAIALQPTQASYWTVLGDILVSEAKGDVSGDAQTAYRRAHALDPSALGPRYYLAKARIAGGDVKGGLADWRALAGDLAADDARKPVLSQEIDVVDKTGALPVETEAQAPEAGQQAFIRSMVAGLAARLRAQPDDPAGWGRLVRSYGVLGDAPHRETAMAEARRLFKDRPDAWRAFEDAAEARQ
jgi:cytochrome c-type biogenesis protein CcmH